MTKAQSGPFDEEDIVTPSSQGQAAEKVGAGLRMPPIIDMAPSWRARLADTPKTRCAAPYIKQALSLFCLWLWADGVDA